MSKLILSFITHLSIYSRPSSVRICCWFIHFFFFSIFIDLPSVKLMRTQNAFERDKTKGNEKMTLDLKINNNVNTSRRKKKKAHAHLLCTRLWLCCSARPLRKNKISGYMREMRPSWEYQIKFTMQKIHIKTGKTKICERAERWKLFRLFAHRFRRLIVWFGSVV